MTVVELLKNNELNISEILELSIALSDRLNSVIYDDSKVLTGVYQNYQDIHCDNQVFLAERPQPVVKFLKHLTDDKRSKNKEDSKKTYSLCLAIEQLYVTRNRMFIGPLSFSQGL